MHVQHYGRAAEGMCWAPHTGSLHHVRLAAGLFAGLNPRDRPYCAAELGCDL